jgi:hypothetical protein
MDRRCLHAAPAADKVTQGSITLSSFLDAGELFGIALCDDLIGTAWLCGRLRGKY